MTTYRIGNHVYYWVPGMVEARSVNVKNTTTTTTLNSAVMTPVDSRMTPSTAIITTFFSKRWGIDRSTNLTHDHDIYWTSIVLQDEFHRSNAEVSALRFGCCSCCSYSGVVKNGLIHACLGAMKSSRCPSITDAIPPTSLCFLS